MTQEQRYDYVVMGSGLGGLTVASLLAKAGHTVALLEKHYALGGYGQTFTRRCADGDYHFCAHLHYVWDCGEGGHVHDYLRKIGLADEVEFCRLDPDGFDTVVTPTHRYRIANGYYNNIRRLTRLFPQCHGTLRRYFDTISALYDQVNALPLGAKPLAVLRRLPEFITAVRYRNATLQSFFDDLRFPIELQAILAGQSGCYFAPPDQVSLMAHAVVVGGYDAGAYYPKKTYRHFVDSIANVIRSSPGSAVFTRSAAKQINVSAGRVQSVTTSDGRSFLADRFISNMDPSVTADMAGRKNFAPRFARKLDFEYSPSVFSLYLGVKGLDLSKHMGNSNLWYYPTNDLNSIYREHFRSDSLPAEPFLFLTAPTQHTPERHLLAPDGHEQLIILACCNYDHFKALLAKDRKLYWKEKERFADAIIDLVDKRLVPGLKDHIALRAVATPTTNERWVSAVRGNCYGSHLDVSNVNFGRLSSDTTLENLFLVGAASGMPGFAGCVTFANKLYERLTGDSV